MKWPPTRIANQKWPQVNTIPDLAFEYVTQHDPPDEYSWEWSVPRLRICLTSHCPAPPKQPLKNITTNDTCYQPTFSSSRIEQHTMKNIDTNNNNTSNTYHHPTSSSSRIEQHVKSINTNNNNTSNTYHHPTSNSFMTEQQTQKNSNTNNTSNTYHQPTSNSFMTEQQTQKNSNTNNTSNTYHQPTSNSFMTEQQTQKNSNTNNTSNTYHQPTSNSSNRGQALMNAWKMLSCMLRARHRSRVRSFLKTIKLAFSTLKGDINRRPTLAWNFKKMCQYF